jgi:ATP-dependent Lon protease
MPMSELKAETYPLMPLRDIVLFPGMVAPLVVGRKKSILALEAAMENRSLIFLVTQKDARVDDPEQQHLYSLGTLASVMQLAATAGWHHQSPGRRQAAGDCCRRL